MEEKSKYTKTINWKQFYGSDGAVLGEERHQNDRESPGYGIKCRTHRCGSIRRSSPWHAGDTDADLYL